MTAPAPAPAPGRHRGTGRARSGRRRPLALLAAVAVLMGTAVFVSGSQTPAYADEFYPVPANGIYVVDGHGWGHGRGMSQYGAQGAAVKGLSFQQIMAFYYPGTTPTAVGNPTVRVQLTATNARDVQVDAGGTTMTIQDLHTNLTAQVPSAPVLVRTSGSAQTVFVHNGTTWVPFSMGGVGAFTGPMAINAPGGLTVHRPGGSSPYRGGVVVAPTGTDTGVAVNYVSLQQYLYGVVPSESPSSWLPAALQSQSVAARSYALRMIHDTKKPYWDICDTTSCQVYGGLSAEATSTNAAVDATSGYALYYQGIPAFTEFSSSNGGYSTKGSQPYLVAKADPYDTGGRHDWTQNLTRSYLESNYGIGSLVGLRVLTRDGGGEWGGRVTSVDVVGTTATAHLGKVSFGMYSSWWRPRSQHNPVGSYDIAAISAPGQVRLAGWTLDPDTSASVQVHAYVDGKATKSITANLSRPDIGALYPGKGDLHGYDFRLSLGQGVRSICLYAMNQLEGTPNTKLGCRSVDLGVAPRAGINSLTLSNGSARLVGWTFDADVPTNPVSVHAYVDGVLTAQMAAGLPRADVATAFPDAGPNHGFDLAVPLTAGDHQLCLYAIDPGPGAGNPQIKCYPMRVRTDPVGGIERLVGTPTTVDVAGWALDTDTPTPIGVRVEVDGAPVSTLSTTGVRADVAVAYPGTGSQHGFAASIPVVPGNHDVCVFAVNVGAGADTQLGCSRVAVGLPPKGGINGLARVVGLQARLTGWAFDPDTTGPINVHVYVNGVARVVLADVNRPDVAAVFPAAGPAHGFDTVLTLRPGANSVCVYAINVAAGANKALGCRSLALSTAAANPLGAVYASTAPRVVNVSGWAVDPDVPTTAIRAHVYLDGAAVRAVTAGLARADVNRAYPFYGPDHGLGATLAAAPGRHTVCVYAINQGAGTGNPSLGCRTVTVPS
jgi:SpoIID/LytB domain protein